MEAREEFIGSKNHTHQILKRKRSKRQSSSSPIAVTAVISSSSSGGGAVVEDYGSSTSPTTSSDIYQNTEEEEDMANCLIMLAQGDFRPTQVVRDGQIRREKFNIRKFAANKAGFDVYKCKTCNRTFPSFQALGGHKASHRKPKPMAMAERMESVMTLPAVKEIGDESQINKITPAGGKIHECSICGSEFTSGQALGGHMRRHRANTSSNNNNGLDSLVAGAGAGASNNTIEVKVPARNILSLDLNFPAPEDYHHHSTIESKVQFATSMQPPPVYSAPGFSGLPLLKTRRKK